MNITINGLKAVHGISHLFFRTVSVSKRPSLITMSLPDVVAGARDLHLVKGAGRHGVVNVLAQPQSGNAKMTGKVRWSIDTHRSLENAIYTLLRPHNFI
jgi:hypothetical protein